jgi:hypothetical protein
MIEAAPREDYFDAQYHNGGVSDRSGDPAFGQIAFWGKTVVSETYEAKPSEL